MLTKEGNQNWYFQENWSSLSSPTIWFEAKFIVGCSCLRWLRTRAIEQIQKIIFSNNWWTCCFLFPNQLTSSEGTKRVSPQPQRGNVQELDACWCYRWYGNKGDMIWRLNVWLHWSCREWFPNAFCNGAQVQLINLAYTHSLNWETQQRQVLCFAEMAYTHVDERRE